jgi:chromosome segregation ATPase
MSKLEAQIKSIQQKQLQLVKRYQSLQRDNEKLLQENAALQELQNKQAEELQQLRLQVNVLKSATGSMDEQEKKAFEKQIAQYIREIDKCIHLLS